jgi:hypothetical protein
MTTDRNRRLTGAEAGPFMTLEAAERHAAMLNDHVAKQARADTDAAFSRREVPGPTYRLEMSLQRQEGDPQQQHLVLREPPEFDRPSLIDLLPSAQRTLSVSQRVEHGPEESRDRASWLGIQQAADLGTMHRRFGLGPETGLRPWIFRSRRGEEKPARVKGWQSETTTEMLRRGY